MRTFLGLKVEHIITLTLPRVSRILWTNQQLKLLHNEFGKGRSFTTKYLMRVLSQANLVLGCTESDIKKKCHAEYVKLGRCDNKDAPSIKELHSILSELEGPKDEELDSTRLALILLPDGKHHIIIDDDHCDDESHWTVKSETS